MRAAEDRLGCDGADALNRPMQRGILGRSRRAQQREHMRRVGVLTALESDPGWRRNFAGFIAGLREAGWTEGQNFRFEFRYVPGGSVDHLRAAPVAEGLVASVARPGGNITGFVAS